MKISHISTYSLFTRLSSQIGALQSQLPRLQAEATNGRLFDSGLELGARSADLAAYKSGMADLGRIKDTNGLALGRLEATQSGLEDLRGQAEQLTDVLLTNGGSVTDPTVAETARDMLGSSRSILNTQIDGVFIFGGINTDVAPLNTYQGGPAQTAFDSAFNSFFGFPKTDEAQVAAISAEQMNDFLETVVEPQFLGADWTTAMSNASDELTQSRIGSDEVRATSVSANEEGIRRITLAAVVAAEMFDLPLPDSARDAAASFALQQVEEGENAVIEVQARTGLIQSRIEQNNEQLTAQSKAVEGLMDGLEATDPTAAATELKALITQIEASYAATVQIQQLSLLRYL